MIAHRSNAHLYYPVSACVCFRLGFKAALMPAEQMKAAAVRIEKMWNVGIPGDAKDPVAARTLVAPTVVEEFDADVRSGKVKRSSKSQKLLSAFAARLGLGAKGTTSGDAPRR